MTGNEKRLASLLLCALGLPATLLLSSPTLAATTYPTCASASSDPDGDGWGWENNASCKVSSSGSGSGGSVSSSGEMYVSGG